MNGLGQPGSQNNVSRQQEPHTPADQAWLEAPAMTNLGATAAGGVEQISALLTGIRTGASTTVGEDTTDPHMVEVEDSP